MAERLEFDAIGTHWTIALPSLPSLASSPIEERISARIEEFDRGYSRFREDSLVARMSREVGVFTLPQDAKPMLDLYHDLYDLTDGAMTPLIGQTLSDAGYDASYRLTPKEKLAKPPLWGEAMTYRFPTLTIKVPSLLDFGAAGKGYLIDLIGEVLEAEGIAEYTIDAGGDIRHRSPSSGEIRVGLEDPEDSAKVIGVATFGNRSICGSAGNRRAWGDYHHVIDPHTLASPRHIHAIWTIADSTMLADGLSTALYFVPPERIAERYSFEYLLMRPDRSITHSAGFPAEVFVPKPIA